MYLYITLFLNYIMKHIGWFLDQIQILMSIIPRELDTQEDKNRATNILYTVKIYGGALAKLIINKKFKKNLYELERHPNKEVRLEAHEIEELFKDLEHMLYVLDLYTKQLKEIIEKHPEEWSKKADQLVLMIDQKFGGERGELRREFQIAFQREKKLEDYVKVVKNLEENIVKEYKKSLKHPKDNLINPK